MSYIWTEKRKAAGKRLVRLVILCMLLLFVSPVVESTERIMTSHVWVSFIWDILVLIGMFSIADDIRILLVLEED